MMKALSVFCFFVLVLCGLGGLLWHQRTSGDIELTRGSQCLHNLDVLGRALRLYSTEHAGRLPDVSINRRNSNLAMALAPYLLRLGYNAKRVMRCPSDIRQDIESSYVLDPGARGKLLTSLRGDDKRILLSDDVPRHKGLRMILKANGASLGVP